MARRLKKELADVEFRISQGSDSCDQFFDNNQLLRCRHSRSKSLFLDGFDFKAPLDFYSRALKGNDDVIHIDFDCYSDHDQLYARVAETIRDMPSVTSIKVNDPQRLPPIQRDTPLFIYDRHSLSLEAFLNSDQSLARTRDMFVFMQHTDRWTIAVSFVGPSSGSLIFRLKHRAHRPDITLTVTGTSFTLSIHESITIDDINLHPDGSSSSLLSFTPNIRNNFIFQVSERGYSLHDLQLLDGDGNPYCQPSRGNIQAEPDALGMPGPDHHESN
jgi:hypothetical protein